MGSLSLKDGDSRENTMWRSALMRSAKLEMDLVYSVMGMFGIALDTSLYSTKDNAMKALRRSILEKGGRVNWITDSLGTSTSNFDWTVLGSPKGSIDQAGVLTITTLAENVSIIAHAVEEEPDTPGFAVMAMLKISSSSGSGYAIEAAAEFVGEAGSLAIAVGEIEQFQLAATNKLLMLVERCNDGENMWRRTGFVTVDADTLESGAFSEQQISLSD